MGLGGGGGAVSTLSPTSPPGQKSEVGYHDFLCFFHTFLEVDIFLFFDVQTSQFLSIQKIHFTCACNQWH